MVGILATTSDFFFPKAPPALYPKIRLAILLCCINAFLTLWASVISGYFTARHRVKVSALVSTVVLTLGSLAMVVSVLHQHSLVMLAAIFAAMGIFNVGGMLLAISPVMAVSLVMPWRATRSTSKKIAVHCLATGWWNLAMLLISGLDLFLVSRIDFGAPKRSAARSNGPAALSLKSTQKQPSKTKKTLLFVWSKRGGCDRNRNNRCP